MGAVEGTDPTVPIGLQDEPTDGAVYAVLDRLALIEDGAKPAPVRGAHLYHAFGFGRFSGALWT